MKGDLHIFDCADGHRLTFEDDGIADELSFARTIRAKRAEYTKRGCDARLSLHAGRRCGKPVRYEQRRGRGAA